MHDLLNERIAALETTINRLAANHELPTPEAWEGLWDEQNAIVQEFRTVKYPTREEKDAAWDIFAGVRELFRILHQDFSTKAVGKLAAAMQPLRYDSSKEKLFENVTFETLKTASDNMKTRQKDFAGVVELFKNVKYIMTKDDKGVVVELLDTTRTSQQNFWEEQQTVYAALRETKDKEYAAKHTEYLRKQQVFKERLANNIKNNEERLQKALNYKANVQDQIVKHNEKLTEDIGDIFRERVLSWKAETEKKLQDVTAQIEKYEQYIAEDQEKMSTL